jgi:hypothetical protein
MRQIAPLPFATSHAPSDPELAGRWWKTLEDHGLESVRIRFAQSGGSSTDPLHGLGELVNLRPAAPYSRATAAAAASPIAIMGSVTAGADLHGRDSQFADGFFADVDHVPNSSTAVRVLGEGAFVVLAPG